MAVLSYSLVEEETIPKILGKPKTGGRKAGAEGLEEIPLGYTICSCHVKETSPPPLFLL